MSIEVRSTKSVKTHGIKAIVYGKAGVGKTTLLATAPNPIIISCESGLLSIADHDLPFIEISTIDDLTEAYEFVKDNDDYDTICLDSISEIGEVLLAELKEQNRDPRKAYGELADKMAKMIRLFRDIKDKNVLFVAKSSRMKDEDGRVMYNVSMPGNNLVQNVPFFFDEVFFMTFMQGDDGEEYRVLRTDTGYSYEAKDRSGKLNPIEKPDISYLFAKIQGESVPETNVPQDLQESDDDEEEDDDSIEDGAEPEDEEDNF